MEIKVRAVLRILKADGWFEVRQKGSHHHFRHDRKPGAVTLAYGKLGDEIQAGTYYNILRQAGLK